MAPFSPWIGSRKTAAVSVVTAARSASMSPNGTWVASGSSGRNGSCLADWAVSVSAPMVRPWKEPWSETTWLRPVSRPILKAASLASAPELQKNTRPSRPESSSSCSASLMVGSAMNRLETWPRVEICAVTASTIAGWAVPSALTAMPATRSRYSLPSASQTFEPSPRTSGIRGVP